MSKGLLDGWTFRTAKTGEGGIYCVAETDNPSFREPRWVYTGAIRMSEAEALADLEAFKPVAEAMEIVRRGGPGMGEMAEMVRELLGDIAECENSGVSQEAYDEAFNAVTRYDAAKGA